MQTLCVQIYTQCSEVTPFGQMRSKIDYLAQLRNTVAMSNQSKRCWKVILEKLKLTNSEVCVNTHQSLQIQFDILLTDLKSMGILQEGLNLSKLQEDNTQVQKLTVSLTMGAGA